MSDNNEKELKHISPFKYQLLQSFPFIAEDFDQLTAYGLFCKLSEKMNEVINGFNNLDDDVIVYINKFNALKEYVENYFSNLDVQEEINNKLDEMAESGELQEIFEQYYQQDYVIINELTLADKFLFLFGNDINNWKMTKQRSNEFDYKVGDCIKDMNSQNIYECTNAGTTGASYPTFNSEYINDGTCIWHLLGTSSEWQEDTSYQINDCVSIKNLDYVCVYAHTSSDADGYNIKKVNNTLYKRRNNNTISNYPSLMLTFGYDNVNKIHFEGMNVPKSAMQVSNDGVTFNIVDTPMLFAGQDFSPYYYNGKYYILTFTKQKYNDFGLYITQNFKDYIKAEIDLNISDETHPHVWFAQWFKDEITDKLYILYTASDLTNPTITYNSNEYPNLRLWKVEVTDLENLTFGTPSPITLSDNSRFDCYIHTRNNVYYLFTRRYIDQDTNSHEGYVEIWTSSNLENWTRQTDRISALNNSGYEAMSVVEMNENLYYMYVSKNLNYDYNRVWRIESTDLINWSNRIPVEPSAMNLDEFGTVILIKDQDALSYLYNYINTNNNSRNIIRPTNYLNLISDKNNVYRNLNYSAKTLNVLSAEDIMYKQNVNTTDIVISTITSNYDLPHRFFIRTTNTGSNYIKLTNEGNIYLPDGLTDAYIQSDIILEFVYSLPLNKYVIVSPSKDYLLADLPRQITLNDLATEGTIAELTLENNCVYKVNINTQLTINAFKFKNNRKGEFKIAFLLEGNGSTHTTSLTINGTNGVLLSQYGTSSSYQLTSTNNSNKYVIFSRLFGTGALRLNGI